MSDLYIYRNLNKILIDRLNQIEQALIHGSVADYTVFKELRVRHSELIGIQQELKNLQKGIEIDEE
jgi:hypothetical protein